MGKESVTNWRAEEIRSILDAGKIRSGITEEMQEPVDEALELLKSHTNLTTLLQRKLDGVSVAFGAANQQAGKVGNKTGEDRKQVLEIFAGSPLLALRELREIIDKSVQHMENVCRRQKWRNDSMGYGGKWTTLGEAKDPMGGSSSLMRYDDYAPAMGKIEPGNAVNLGGMVFRVIGKSGNSAVVQPESLRQQVARYVPGKAYPTPQSPVPSGYTTPQDATTQAIQAPQNNPTGHTSLVGTSVLKYNPHTGQFSFVNGKVPGEYEMATAIQIVGHDPALPNIAGESITPEKLELMLSEAEGDSILEKLRAVAAGDGPQKVNDVLVDPFSASAAVRMYEGLSAENQERMAGMGIHEVLRVTYNVMGKVHKTDSE
jgi:hypothetical protein